MMIFQFALGHTKATNIQTNTVEQLKILIKISYRNFTNITSNKPFIIAWDFKHQTTTTIRSA